MRFNVTKKIVRHTLVLSLLLHLLVLFSMTMMWVEAKPLQKPPSMFVPSYVYQSATTPPPELPQTVTKKVMADKNGIEKPVPQHHSAAQQKSAPPVARKIPNKQEEPIHLIGDKNTIPSPIIKLLGRALYKHLKYPRIAVEFRLTGTAYVGFTLRPDGLITDVKIVRSSDAGVLDDEARNAVNAISPLAGVDQFVKKPKYMVIGIIFR